MEMCILLCSQEQEIWHCLVYVELATVCWISERNSELIVIKVNTYLCMNAFFVQTI